MLEQFVMLAGTNVYVVLDVAGVTSIIGTNFCWVGLVFSSLNYVWPDLYMSGLNYVWAKFWLGFNSAFKWRKVIVSNTVAHLFA
jgi:hypothetical protein